MTAPTIMTWAGALMALIGASGLLLRQLPMGLSVSDSAAMAAGFVLVAGSVLLAGGIMARRLADLLHAAGVGD